MQDPKLAKALVFSLLLVLMLLAKGAPDPAVLAGAPGSSSDPFGGLSAPVEPVTEFRESHLPLGWYLRMLVGPPLSWRFLRVRFRLWRRKSRRARTPAPRFRLTTSSEIWEF
jgi:hypothetical protein